VALRRGAALVLALLAFAVVLSVVGLLVLYAMVGRAPTVASGSILIVRLSGSLEEGGPSSPFGDFLPMARAVSVRSVTESLRRAKSDARIGGVLVVPAGLSSPYWAKLQEVRDAIADFRRSGKPAYAFLEYGGQAEYFVASTCNRVFLLPTSVLDLTGLASYELFLRGTLDKIGAHPDMVHIGQYKSAVNQLTETTFTPAHREMAESLNRDLFEQLVRGVADGRRRSERDIQALVDEGPFLSEDAVRAGLVDDLAYEDEAFKKLEDASRARNRVELADYARTGGSMFDFAPRFALIYVTGTITSGRSGFDPLSGATVGSESLVEHLRAVREDSSIRAVILRIDSPGGSAVASDVIWRELTLVRDGKRKLPLVVSMSDLAASGGYYIAMAAPTIVAEPGTLTGSIGIFGGKVALGGTYNKLGATIEEVSNGRRAAMNSPARPFTADERAKLEDQLRAFYEQFVEKAAKARHMTPERLDEVAQGRVWTGRQARDLKLVDELGGLDRAIALARKQAGLDEATRVELVVYPRRRSLYDLLAGQLSGGSELARLAAFGGLTGGDRIAAALARPALFRPGEPLAIMPEIY